MYMIMFAAGIRLRRTQPNVVRTYRTPAMNLVAGVGFVFSAIAFILAFIRPSGFTGLSETGYPIVVAVVVIVLGGPPLLFYALRRPGWDKRTEAEKSTSEGVLVNPPPTTASSSGATSASPASPPPTST